MKYKAYTYASYKSPIIITDEEIKLVKKDDGYTIPKNQILVRVHSAALNPFDLVMYQSDYFPFTYLNPRQGVGRDYSGVIEAIGDIDGDDLGYKVGDKICGLYTRPFGKGTVAEYVVIDIGTDRFSPIPSNLSFEEASSWPLVYGTAFALLDGVDVKDKKVLILGAASSVGRYTLSMAKKAGAKEIVTTNSERSLDIISRLGATSQIDYTKHNSILGPVLESVKESGSFDVVLDCCGGDDLFSEAKAVLSKGAVYNTVAGDKRYAYDEVTVLKKVLTMGSSVRRSIASGLGLLHYTYKSVFCLPDQRWCVQGKQYIEDGDAEVFIDHVYEFDELNEAMTRMTSGRVNGKLVVKVI